MAKSWHCSNCKLLYGDLGTHSARVLLFWLRVMPMNCDNWGENLALMCSHFECGVSGGCQPGVKGKNVTPPQGCFLVFVLSMFPLNRTFQKFPIEYISFEFLLYKFRFSYLLSHSSSFVWILIPYSLHDSFIRRVFGGMLSGTVCSIWRALDEERPSPFFCTSKLAD